MCEKTLFTLFFTVHMPWCTVHVAGLKKKQKKQKNKTKQNAEWEMRIQTQPEYSQHNKWNIPLTIIIQVPSRQNLKIL